MRPIAEAPPPAESRVKRMVQKKQLAQRFSASQEVEGQYLKLRWLPRPIDRYVPNDEDRADGAIFVFASGRMPGMILLIESDGTKWYFGVGRLSRPSQLIVELDGVEVWRRRPSPRSWTAPYTSTYTSVRVP